MVNIETQHALPCHDACPFIQGNVRLCGLGYEGRKKMQSSLKGAVEAIVDRQEKCRNAISPYVEAIDLARSSNIAGFTDGDMTMPHMLTISHHTDAGLIPIAGIVDGIFSPIKQFA